MTPRIITVDEAREMLDAATPGPWNDERIGADGDGSACSHEHQLCNADGIAVAIITHDGAPSARANDRLLAAAPDLAATVIAQAADIERLRSIIDGRTTAPSDAEITAHGTAAGRWRWASPDQHGEFPSTARWRASVAVVARVPGVRWWATDSDKRPCAWPVVAEASR